VNLLDAVIVVVAAAAAVGGYRLGFLARVASWIGLALGLYVAARFLPRVINALNRADPAARLMIAALILIGGAFVGQAVGLLAGGRLHRALPLGPLRDMDRGVGAAVGTLGVLVALWLLLPSMAAVAGWPAREARTSTIAQWVDRTFPPAPDTLQALRRLVGDNTFPQVFEALHPTQGVGPPPASSGLDAAVVGRVASSTVKVEGEACNRIQDGSGFAAAPDTIVTNAHVVAGEPAGRTQVLRPDGRTLAATIVLFDPDRDLALLRVPGLGQAALPTAGGVVGQVGAVFGHPGGQDPLAVAPAAIRQNVTAVGRNLYDTHTTRRDVFVLAAALHPGDSGGPLVSTDGAVLGVAFAIAPDQPGTSYALTAAVLAQVLGLPRSAPVTTGSCLTG
jgi:S1-C subfamily serine protease